ncbi:leucine-rich repeat domain-containing protein [Wenyingzhuangia sp. IMCC45574]
MKKITLLISSIAVFLLSLTPTKANSDKKLLHNNAPLTSLGISFEEHLVTIGLDNAVDGEIPQTPEILATTHLDVSHKNLNDLDGIEVFENLEALFAVGNNLTTIDLSSNSKLSHLSLKENDLDVLDLSANTELKELYACANNFVSIDLSNTPLLTHVGLKYNKLIAIDVSNNPLLELLEVHSNTKALNHLILGTNPNLKYLFASHNSLTSIDLSGVLNLQELHLNDNLLTGLLNLESHTELRVVNLCNNLLEDITDCAYSKVEETKATFNTLEEYLVHVGLDNAIDGTIPVTPEITTMKVLDIPKTGISDMSGIETFVGLEELHAAWNKINILDLTNNTALKTVNVVGNQITNLNVTDLTLLEGLFARSNKLTSIDLSTNTALKEISLKYNSLNGLDISAINNVEYLEVVANEIMTSLIIGNQPNLTTIYAHCNMFTNVDISGAPNIKILRLQHNKLEGTLNLSNHTKLEQVILFNNKLEQINLKNGTNNLILNDGFNVKQNELLTCVIIDDETYSSTNWLNITAASIFTEDETCGVAPTTPDPTPIVVTGVEVRDGQIVIPNDVDRIEIRVGFTLVNNENLSGIYLVTYYKNNGSTYSRLVFVL